MFIWDFLEVFKIIGIVYRKTKFLKRDDKLKMSSTILTRPTMCRQSSLIEIRLFDTNDKDVNNE